MIQEFKVTNSLIKGNDSIKLDLVALQMLVIDSAFKIETKYDKLSAENYPLFNEENQITGQQLMLRNNQGEMKIIRLPQKRDVEYRFNKQSQTLSSF